MKTNTPKFWNFQRNRGIVSLSFTHADITQKSLLENMQKENLQKEFDSDNKTYLQVEIPCSQDLQIILKQSIAIKKHSEVWSIS